MAQNYRYTTIQQGISFGSALAIVLSFTTIPRTAIRRRPSQIDVRKLSSPPT